MSFFVVAICRTCLSMGHLLKAPLLLLFKGTFDFSYKTRPPVVSVQFIFRRVVVIIFQTDERLGQTRFCLAHRRPLFYCVLGSDDSWSRAAVYLPQKCHDLLFYFFFFIIFEPHRSCWSSAPLLGAAEICKLQRNYTKSKRSVGCSDHCLLVSRRLLVTASCLFYPRASKTCGSCLRVFFLTFLFLMPPDGFYSAFKCVAQKSLACDRGYCHCDCFNCSSRLKTAGASLSDARPLVRTRCFSRCFGSVCTF